MKLTQVNVTTILPEPGKFERRVFDDDLPGFGVRVRDRKKPKRTWIVQYRRKRDGKSVTHKIGRFPKMSASVARELARKELAQAELGADLAKEKQTERRRAAETFKTVAERFLKFKASNVRPRSFEQIETHVTKHWSNFNSTSIHGIARRDIALRLNEIADQRGPYAANRARATLSSFFSWAMSEGLVEANQVIGTNRQTDEKARDRVLSDTELAAIWKACGDDDYSAIVKLLILTGVRREEAGGITRSEVDLRDRKWTIGSHRTKNGLVHEVPLSDAVLTILKARLARPGREEREAIFGDGEAGRGFSGWSKAKAALDKSLAEQKKVAEWRLHDLRRTVATKMADIGILPHVIEAVLNHISGHKSGVAGIYNRSQYAPEKRQALDQWAAHIEALVAGKRGSNIVAMKKGRS
jgi:integrase